MAKRERTNRIGLATALSALLTACGSSGDTRQPAPAPDAAVDQGDGEGDAVNDGDEGDEGSDDADVGDDTAPDDGAGPDLPDAGDAGPDPMRGDDAGPERDGGGSDPDCEGAPAGTTQTRLAFESVSVAFGETCRSEEQLRSCVDGQWTRWTGTFAAETCEPLPPAPCGDLPHGGQAMRTQFRQATAPSNGTCESELQVQTCSNGELSGWSGTFTHEVCMAACGELVHLETRTRDRFRDREVAAGVACESEQQTQQCVDGVLSSWTGTFTATECSVCDDADGDHRGAGCIAGPDCDDTSDACSQGCGRYTFDGDGDGFGDPASAVDRCQQPAGSIPVGNADCDDSDERHHADCGQCVDEDDDGYGEACDLGPDCDDDDAVVNPGRPDLCPLACAEGADWATTSITRNGYRMRTALELDAEGGLHIAHYGGYAHRAAGEPNFTNEYVGEYSNWAADLALDDSGRLHLVTWHPYSDMFGYATRAPGVASWKFSDLEATDDPISEIAIDVDHEEGVHIVYDIEDVRYAYRGAGDSAFTITTIETDCGGAGSTSVVTDAAGGVHALYYCGILRYAYLAPDSTAWEISSVDYGMAWTASIAVDAAGGPHVAYHFDRGRELRYATRGPGGEWMPTTVDTEHDTGSTPSITLDAQGGVHITYYDLDEDDLRYAVRAAGEDDWTLTTVDSEGDVGAYSSLELDRSGRAHVSYASGDGTLRYAQQCR